MSFKNVFSGIALSLLIFFSTSCATILNSRWQKVVIHKEPDAEIYVNNEPAKIKKGKYLLERNGRPKQITVKQEGAKDQNLVLFPYKMARLKILSFVPFGVFFLIPPFYDIGFKSKDYERELHLQKNLTLGNRTADEKDIKVNKISFDIEKEDSKYRYFSSYYEYRRRNQKTEAEQNTYASSIKLEQTVFANELNKVLKQKGYIDTTAGVLSSSYSKNMFVNASVQDYTIHHINAGSQVLGQSIYIDLTIKWELLDYYKVPVFETVTNSVSDQFAILAQEEVKERSINNAMERSISDAIEVGLIEFLKNDKVKSLLRDKSQIKREVDFEKLIIKNSGDFVSNLNEAIKSSVTIKTKEGFGSGFIIGEDGYIVTNYHVVSRPKELSVITNDKKEHVAKIIRTSKIYDLALLKIDSDSLLPFKVNFDHNIEIAKEVFAVGTPSSQDLSQTISKGIISGIRDVENNSQLIQTDASINNGNSGGPLVSKEGVVQAVVSSKLKGFGVEGVAFGIPSYEIQEKLNISFE